MSAGREAGMAEQGLPPCGWGTGIMRTLRLTGWLMAGAVCLAATAPPAAANPANDGCLGCHGSEGLAARDAQGQTPAPQVVQERFAHSVHGSRSCLDCHADITEVPHQKGVSHTVNCVTCHDSLWKAAVAGNRTAENARLAVVVEQIDHYQKSIHARPRRDDQSRVNANCQDCHAPHYIGPAGSAERAEWRLSIPDVCGKCHASEREQYAVSVHGKAVLNDGNPGAAICSDCHTSHDVADPTQDDARLAITANCGGCHAESLATYTGTYHGQVNTLGYAYTAKCYDCHGSHGIQRTDDPKSPVHPDQRLATCQKCHEGATSGFVSFEPHGTADDFERFPAIWLASKLLLLLIAGTLVFFWSHTALWMLRELKERQQRKTRTYVKTAELQEARFKGKQYQRFPVVWRVVHLMFAISVLMLALTGMAVLYADTTWAPVVIHWLGGPKVAAIVHRTFAVLFLVVFLGQLVYFLIHMIYRRKTIEWFGPDTLAPRMQDLRDILAMFKWFFGLGPRPVFDRFTYWQKFDYWAPFAAVIVISICGLMLWASNTTAAFLPGWVFNVATIFHGELALLALLFLVTVHLFNNHFRPDKFPLDIVMFTGSMPLEVFRRDHRVQYNRLVAGGELEKYLVDAPSQPMTLASKVLGFALIAFALLLLVLVLIGVFENFTGG
jgi:cytochrome b subunit of formate dehydrogenase